jgi:hypothetical protein
MKNTLTIEVDDEKTQRLLRKILHQQEKIFEVLDSFDDISDVIEKMKLTTQQIRGIAPNSEE